MKRLRNFIIENWRIMAVIIAAMAFFVFASSFNYLSQTSDFVKWLSPDETANYTVSKLYAETGSLQFFEKYNLIAKDLIHPRSFRSDWGWVKPVSFIGMPLMYGTIGRLAGVEALPYITPFIGAIGIIFFYLLIKRIFDKNVAVVSALLLSVFPVYIYFSARSFFHNILFTVLFIIGLYFTVMMARTKEPKEEDSSRRIIFSLLGGLCTGAAITARASELMWVAPLLIGLYIFNFRKINILHVGIWGLSALIACIPMLEWNQILYGSWRASGYPELNNSLYTLQANGKELTQTATTGNFAALQAAALKIKTTVFHFGFNPGQSKRMFIAYVKDMFPWLFWLGGIGVVAFIAWFKKYSLGRWLFLFAWIGVSGILIMYYGSWVFFDNPDPRSFTIGNSYTRYWLPVYLGALPFISFLFVRLTEWMRPRLLSLALPLVAIVAIATVSIQFVWGDSSEGIKASIDKQLDSKDEWREVLGLTEPNAVIITRYHDKLLFPERKVLIGLFTDKNMIAEYAVLAKRLPVYYYNFNFQTADVEYLNNGPLKEAGINLAEVKKVTDRFTLYRVNVNLETNETKTRK